MLPNADAQAQSALPPVTVDSPRQRARPAAVRPGQRASASRATAPVASRAPQATTAVTAAIGATLRYTASVISDVNGGADTRFGDQQIRGFDTTQQCLFLDGLRQPNTRYVQFMGLDTWARSASRS